MRIAVGAVYQTVTRSRCRMPYQVGGVELGLGDHAGHAVGQRRDDAVAGAGDPAGVGRAPEDVVVVQVERVVAGDVMRHHRLVHMDRALGPAGGAAGEMQQRAVLRVGRRDDEIRRSASSTSRCQSSVPGSSVGASPSSGTRITCSQRRQAARASPRPCGGTALRWSPARGLRRSSAASRCGSGPKAENSGETTHFAFSAPSTAM